MTPRPLDMMPISIGNVCQAEQSGSGHWTFHLEAPNCQNLLRVAIPCTTPQHDIKLLLLLAVDADALYWIDLATSDWRPLRGC